MVSEVGTHAWKPRVARATVQPVACFPLRERLHQLRAPFVARSSCEEEAALSPATQAEESQGIHSQRYTGAPS